jgi:hypothetical protein
MNGNEHDVKIENVGGWDGWVFAVEVDDSEDVPVVRSLTISPPDGADLADVVDAPLRRIVRSALATSRPVAIARFSDVVGHPLRRPHGLGSPAPEAIAAHREQVAAVYRLAVERGIPAITAVSTFYQVGSSTVVRWVQEAREAGVLE